MITQEQFGEALETFNTTEKRAPFYDLSVGLLQNGHEIEGYILLLAIWNTGNFRFTIKDFDINQFRETIQSLTEYFNRLTELTFKTIDLDVHKDTICHIYNRLSSLSYVKYTGASKIMHLKNRDVFVMWDDYIGGRKTGKYYKRLPCYRRYKKYRKDATGYFQFLKDMQQSFKNINYQNHQRTFAKAIDEFNYATITIPIQRKEKRNRKRKSR